MGIQVGEQAPDFTLPTQSGGQVHLADYRGQKVVVLYFYPKDFTSGCTKEACTFRDNYEVFTEAGAEVIGVSGDSAAKHGEFAAKHSLPFVLAADTDGSVRKAYGVPKTMGLLPGRVTYVIDRDGVVRNVFNSQTAIGRHVDEALQIVKGLGNG
jgi:thioredoxin-dependent peroxiredoxin